MQKNSRVPSSVPAIAAAGLFAALASGAFAQAPKAADPLAALRPVDEAMLNKPSDGDWLMWRRTYDDWGYSPLTQINKSNVKSLHLAWTWSMNSGPTENAPIVHDGVLFVDNAGDKIQALNAATGDLLWQYARELPDQLVAEGGNTLAKRNMAIYENKLFITTSDDHIVALDVKTGKPIWDHVVADWKQGWRYSSGPFMADGVLIAGMSGCNKAQPGGCFITGHDPESGKELWRVHTIAQPGDPNENTWNGLPADQRFGASAWIAGSYDPQTQTVFYGTGQPYPWIAEILRHVARQAGLEQRRALFGHDARDRSEDRQGQMALSTSAQRPRRSRSGVRTRADRSAGRRQTAQGAGDDRQARHHRCARSNERRVSVVEADRLSERRLRDRSEDRRQNAEPGRAAAYRPDDGELPGRSRFARLAGDGLQSEDGHVVCSADQFCAHTTPSPLDPGKKYTGGGLAVYQRGPVPNSDGNFGRLDAVRLSTRTHLSHETRAASSSAKLCRRPAALCSPGPSTACSAPSTIRPAKCCGRRD